jgi:hypothetical protein
MMWWNLKAYLSTQSGFLVTANMTLANMTIMTADMTADMTW